jgi:hypothetical protein
MASKAHLNEDTKKIWSEKLGRQITDEEAEAIEEIFIRFFNALLEGIDE